MSVSTNPNNGAILIAPTTALANSEPFSGVGNNKIGITCNGLQGTETLTLQYYDLITSSFIDVKVSSLPFQCDTGNNLMVFGDNVITYRVQKSVTASAVGCCVFGEILTPNLRGY